MSGKQNFIMFIGIIIIIMVFWANGYWSVLYNGIFAGSSNQPAPSSNIPKAVKGKCPAGYTYSDGLCFPQAIMTPGI